MALRTGAGLYQLERMEQPTQFINNVSEILSANRKDCVLVRSVSAADRERGACRDAGVCDAGALVSRAADGGWCGAVGDGEPGGAAGRELRGGGLGMVFLPTVLLGAVFPMALRPMVGARHVGRVGCGLCGGAGEMWGFLGFGSLRALRSE